MEEMKKAEKMFCRGYNCAQSVFAAYAGKFGMPEDMALRLSAPLGGGVGRMREVCGAFSACAMIAGLQFADNTSDADKKKHIYEITQKLADEFKKRNGSIICRELLALQKNADTPAMPDKRNEKYYASRPCLKIVRSATDIIDESILNKESL